MYLFSSTNTNTNGVIDYTVKPYSYLKREVNCKSCGNSMDKSHEFDFELEQNTRCRGIRTTYSPSYSVWENLPEEDDMDLENSKGKCIVYKCTNCNFTQFVEIFL